MPVIVQSDGQNIAILLVLKRLEGDWPFSSSVEVVPEELQNILN